MNTKTQVDTLWRDMREAVSARYAAAEKTPEDEGWCLRDYAECVSWSDAMRSLLGRETANERQHRRNRPSIAGFSNETAAKLILLGQMAHGAEADVIPRATAFLVFRQTAIEAQVIGWLAREFLSQEWRDAVNALDYAKLMKA